MRLTSCVPLVLMLCLSVSCTQGSASSSQGQAIEAEVSSVLLDEDEPWMRVWQPDTIKATFYVKTGSRIQMYEFDSTLRTLHGKWVSGGSEKKETTLRLTERRYVQLLNAVQKMESVFDEPPPEGEPTCTEGLELRILKLTKKSGRESLFQPPPDSQGCELTPTIEKYVNAASAGVALGLMRALLPEPSLSAGESGGP